ncbi:DNA protecting protein DprA [Candidatus Wolfebacteria bacterium RIFCSPLOWO2_01_FULL_45_19]|uniref:DNA protecting protein DprA n=1 Tax=Candidatus Wolfebacteria bacterium RIFCSPLOWO2_01_FULL_45_19 TaxID=1802557 RepID=A0A1F8DQV8_9BACT|nr:MAG: protecting protein DprA protein [Parcubacteria group bacterium GW2011_GWB1_45_9]OGM90994.1 MAG: DNA protecting protein DprA [Candidatus Wolfebacteria bacterium RIFCSPLOWO2_01_FULL_45_19]
MKTQPLSPSLKEIPNPPKNFYVEGILPDFSRPWLAIVGTRKATSEGLRLAKNFAKELAQNNCVIVSGLALGIDSAAHQGALDGGGQTVAVLANGLDNIYPAQNENLAKKILETGGAIVSEYPDGTPSLPHQFLERNRIISGLSIATVVIEAPQKSGALATAGFAASQGREVFVIPGPISHSNYRGSHALIRDGARLVTSPEEVLEDLGLQTKELKNNATLPFGGSDEQKKIIYHIESAGRPLAVDEIIILAKLEPRVVNRELALLTIQSIIKETEKGYTI